MIYFFSKIIIITFYYIPDHALSVCSSSLALPLSGVLFLERFLPPMPVVTTGASKRSVYTVSRFLAVIFGAAGFSCCHSLSRNDESDAGRCMRRFLFTLW